MRRRPACPGGRPCPLQEVNRSNLSSNKQLGLTLVVSKREC